MDETIEILKDGCKCVPCGLEWSLAEHRDNQNWAIRHIRELEAKVDKLEAAIDALHQLIVMYHGI